MATPSNTIIELKKKIKEALTSGNIDNDLINKIGKYKKVSNLNDLSKEISKKISGNISTTLNDILKSSTESKTESTAASTEGKTGEDDLDL